MCVITYNLVIKIESAFKISEINFDKQDKPKMFCRWNPSLQKYFEEKYFMIFFKFLSLGIKSKAYRQLGMQLKNGKRQLGFFATVYHIFWATHNHDHNW